jgi:hypothetical protein
MFLPLWFNGLPNDEADRLALQLTNSKFLLNRLDTVIRTKIDETERVSVKDYDSPSWAYKAADREGYIRALKELLLLTKENPLSKKD